MLRRIAASDYARIELIILGAKNQPNSSDRVSRAKSKGQIDRPALNGGGDWRHFRKLRTLLSRCISRQPDILERWAALINKPAPEPNALALVDCSDLLTGIPTIQLRPKDNDESFAPDDINPIKAHDLDVLIPIGVCLETPEMQSAARLGAWSFAHDQVDAGSRFPVAGTWEVIEQEPCTECVLQMHSDRTQQPLVLVRTWFATVPFSVVASRNEVYWKSTSLLPRKLRELYRLGETAFWNELNANKRPEVTPISLRDRQTTPTKTAIKRLLPQLQKDATTVAHQKQVSWEQWILLFTFEQDDGPSRRLSRYKRLSPPADRYWADPFPILKDGCYWVFFEEYMLSHEKGWIAALKIDRSGTIGAPQKVLERPYHVSYPCILELNGTWYMVPETKQNRTVELYECVSFPDQWKFCRVLLDEIQAVDPTVFRYDDKWWMFVNVSDNRSLTAAWDELCVFFTDDLLHGEWRPHARNPVVSDVRRARPAGALFKNNGILYRPGQDCSRCYGYGIRLHAVSTLTADGYQEHEVAFIEPSWARDLIGVHTLNFAPGLSVADALIRRPRVFK